MGEERRIGKRACQKREWDRVNNKDVCPSCGGLKTKSARRCRECKASPQTSHARKQYDE